MNRLLRAGKSILQRPSLIYLKKYEPVATISLVNTRNASNVPEKPFADTINSPEDLPNTLFATDSFFTTYLQKLLIDLHQTTSYDWWLCITIATISLRLLFIFPLNVYQERIRAKIESLEPVVKEELKKSLAERKIVATKKSDYNRLMRKEIKIISNKIYTRENCKPTLISVASFLQIPLWVVTSIALRNVTFANNNADSFFMQTEGLLWFQNLLLPDPYYILPIIYTLAGFASVKYKSLTPSPIPKTNLISYSVIVMIALICAKLPSSVAFFWTLSSIANLVEAIIIDQRATRKLFGIKTNPLLNQSPFALKYSLLKTDIANKRNKFTSLFAKKKFK